MNQVRLQSGTAAPAWALLGRAKEVRTESGPVRLGSGWWLAADPRGGSLLLGADSVVRETSRAADPRAVYLRERFTGLDHDGRRWSLPALPEVWDDLGPALSILYESDKVNGGGTGRPELFRHEFSPGATAYRAGDLVAIVGKRIRVDAAGVRN